MNEYEFFSNVDNWREIYKDCFEKNIITNAIVFESNVLRNKIVKELLDGSYVIGLPRIVDIQKDDGGTRRLLVLNDKDRVVFTIIKSNKIIKHNETFINHRSKRMRRKVLEKMQL